MSILQLTQTLFTTLYNFLLKFFLDYNALRQITILTKEEGHVLQGQEVR